MCWRPKEALWTTASGARERVPTKTPRETGSAPTKGLISTPTAVSCERQTIDVEGGWTPRRTSEQEAGARGARPNDTKFSGERSESAATRC